MTTPPVFDPTWPLTEGTTLLQASAGTGKTYNITNLVLRFVAEYDVDLREILVVTFTRAATSELRDRVRRRLNDAVVAMERAIADPRWVPDPGHEEILHHLVESARSEGDDAPHRWLRRLVDARSAFDDATISTIHGFCSETLNDSAFESDVDFDAELVENLDGLLEEITHDFIVRELRNSNQYWYGHLRAHGVKREDLLGLARHVEAEPYLAILPTDPLPDPERAWEDAVARFRDTWEATREETIAWLRAQRGEGRLSIKAYREEMDDILVAIQEWCDGIGARYPTICKWLKNLSTQELSKRTGDAYVDHPIFAEVDRLIELGGAPATAFKVRFVDYVRGELDRRKRERNILSFNDLLRGLRDALASDETRDALHATLQDRFQVALIDEFQDTDPVQWAIFDTVFGPHGHLYLIGDPKQAIFAFRGADVHTYLAAAKGVDDHATLVENWRSDQRYVSALNHLFERFPAAAGAAGGAGVMGHPSISYIGVHAPEIHQEDRLRFPDGQHATLDLAFVSRSMGDGSTNISKGWATRNIPDLVARDIVEFLDSGAQVRPADDAQLRGVLPRDVAVLTRTNDQAQEIQDALQEAGVHAVAAGGGTVFESPEAVSLQRILDGLLHPHSERDAKAAATTPLLGVEGSALVTMDEREWEDWLERFATWSSVWREHGVVEAFRRMFDEAGVRARLLSLPRGERRLTNVIHLLELLHAEERAERLGPSALSTWLRQRRHDPRKDQAETEIRLESDEDAVTVVTIHRAKGLEYPVVWCPYLWEGNLLFPGEDRNLRFHNPGADDELTLDLNTDAKREPKATHKTLAEREAWQENLRKFYVALTRAKHRCTVYWGAFYGYGRSPLGHVLHGFDVTDDLNTKIEDPLLYDVVRTLEERSGGTISSRQLTEVASVPEYVGTGGGSGVDLEARSLTRTLDRQWMRTSFTGLTRRDDGAYGSGSVAQNRDVDADTEPAPADAASDAVMEDGEPAGPAEEVPLARFPRGADAGSFFHDVLEHLDFTQVDDPAALQEQVHRQLGRSPLQVPDDVDVVGGLRLALRTPLGSQAGDACLADIPLEDRLSELSFDLPLLGGYQPVEPDATIDVSAIADVFQRHASDAPLLGRYAERLQAGPNRPVRGFLSGFIDLVFRRDVDGSSRYFVVDHKSNWHGDRRTTRQDDRSTVDHYRPDLLADTMIEHDYVLQAHLYLVAVHRLLRWRLGASYDYDDHVGGILYLFLRGMIGPDTPRDEDGVPHGVFAFRPSIDLVDELDALLAGAD